jgi:hypothetical protein
MSISKLIALSALPFAYGQWNFAKGGEDWKETNASCKLNKQSPISLPMDSKDDNFSTSMEVPSMKVTFSL